MLGYTDQPWNSIQVDWLCNIVNAVGLGGHLKQSWRSDTTAFEMSKCPKSWLCNCNTGKWAVNPGAFPYTSSALLQTRWLHIGPIGKHLPSCSIFSSGWVLADEFLCFCLSESGKPTACVFDSGMQLVIWVPYVRGLGGSVEIRISSLQVTVTQIRGFCLANIRDRLCNRFYGSDDFKIIYHHREIRN